MKNETRSIKPLASTDATIDIPGSKSITNRVLIIAALSNGTCHLKNALFSDDTRYMQEALKQLAIPVEGDEQNNEILITGTQGIYKSPNKDIYLGNAGTAIRFLTAFLTLGQGEFTLTGNDRMHERPIQDLVDGLRLLGGNITYLKKNGYPPIQIHSHSLKGGKTKMAGSVSSQYFSSILLSGPYAEKDIEIEVIGDLVSKPYIDITRKIMEDFGVQSSNKNYKLLRVPAGQIYQHRDYVIEGDASNASYFWAAAAVTGGKVRVNNIDFTSKQGDIRFVELLEKMGSVVRSGENYIEVEGRAMKGIDVDMRDISDVVQTLAIVALFAEGKTVIRNVENMRVKETDRLKALYNELTKLGCKVEEHQDGLTIHPQKTYRSAVIDTYDDHRMAMAFSIAGLKIGGIEISDPNCVSKTFPHYFSYLDQLY